MKLRLKLCSEMVKISGRTQVNATVQNSECVLKALLTIVIIINKKDCIDDNIL